MNAQIQKLHETPHLSISPLTERLGELRDDWATGQRRLEGLDAERRQLRETLLRIAGAIQVLEELSGDVPPGAGAAAP